MVLKEAEKWFSGWVQEQRSMSALDMYTTCTYVCVQVINDIYDSLTLSVARLPNE